MRWQTVTTPGGEPESERGILVERGEAGIAFRHGLVREVLLHDLPSAERRTQHRRIAELLGPRGAEPIVIAEHWLRAGETREAVASLLAAAAASYRVHAYRDAASTYRRALDEDRGTLVSPVDVLERMAECLELSGDLGEAAWAWETAAAARTADGRPDFAGEAQRRRARVLEVQGRWARAIEARLAAVTEFEAAGRPADAATERLAAAAHLRSAANFTAALGLLSTARSEAHEAGRADLEARAIGLEGNVLARMGKGDDGLRLVREGLTLALDNGLTTAAAELFQRLADSLEHAGSYDPAQTAYLEGAAYCRTRSIESTAQLCLACMSVVLWQTGRLAGGRTNVARGDGLGGRDTARPCCRRGHPRDGRRDAWQYRAGEAPPRGLAADRPPDRADRDGTHLELGPRGVRPARR